MAKVKSKKPDRLLFHYCSTDAFVSIVRERTIRLSALSQSNDWMEGRVLTRAMAKLAAHNGLHKQALNWLVEHLDFMEDSSDGLGFCLSEVGDLLSQWRGYADNASGVAIGFSHRFLKALVASTPWPPGLVLQQVIYDPIAQEKEIQPLYERLRDLSDSDAFQRRGALSDLMKVGALAQLENDERTQKAKAKLASEFWTLLGPMQHVFKSKAFQEEREWRLVSPYSPGVDHGCNFRARGAAIIPYRDFKLMSLKISPIARVILGPRHPTPPAVVKALLAEAGFGQVEIRKSRATYR